ncbi:Zc2hc1c, partial [Symbiodinium sp. KB8]
PAGGSGKGGAWKAKSEQLRAAMKANRMMAAAKARGQDIATLDLPSVPDVGSQDLVPCPHCGRTFNETAAERHIPRCKTTKARPSRLVKGGGRNMGHGRRR